MNGDLDMMVEDIRTRQQAMNGDLDMMVELSPVELVKRLTSDIFEQTQRQSQQALALAHQMLNSTVDESRQLGDECVAYREDFPAEGLPCIFPFNYHGVKNITSCTKADDDQYWCATETDKGGNYIPDKFGYCTENCEIVTNDCYAKAGPRAGARCVFPFKFSAFKCLECTDFARCVFPFKFSAFKFLECTD